MANFLDIQLPEQLVSFFDKKVQYVTGISKMNSGAEFRKDITECIKIYSLFKAIKRSDQIALFEDFFHIVKGRMYSFKMIDKTDYKIEQNEAFKINKNTVQIQKVVQFGEMVRVNKITKPKDDTVKVFKNGALLVNGYEVNFHTGQISFTQDISNDTIAISCEFFQHLRFNSDTIVFSMKDSSSFEVQNVEMIEVI